MTLVYTDIALKQLKKMDKQVSNRILDYMDEVAKLENPRERGKMLVGNLIGFWRLAHPRFRPFPPGRPTPALPPVTHFRAILLVIRLFWES